MKEITKSDKKGRIKERKERNGIEKGEDTGRVKVKGKVIPLQTWTAPEGSRNLRLPDFKANGGK